MARICGAICALFLAGSAVAAPLDPSKGLHIDPSSLKAPDHVLAARIVTLFNEDQAYLQQLGRAQSDPAFHAAYSALAKRMRADPKEKNFYSDDLYELWAKQPGAPELVRRYSAFREATNADVRRIVEDHGWPLRGQVGDQAAAGFFFLFGHADHDNAWRATQLQTIDRVFKHDHLNPRLYAHMVDRITDLGSGRQRFGTIMGPGAGGGTAELYAPLINDAARTDSQRRRIGLPRMRDDFAAYRSGAQIGPFMTPLQPDAEWSLSDAYTPRAPDGPRVIQR